MFQSRGKPRCAYHLSGVVDAEADTVDSSWQRAQVPHLPIAVEKGMVIFLAGGRLGKPRHLLRSVEAAASTIAAAQGAQVPHLPIAVEKGVTRAVGRAGRIPGHLPGVVEAEADTEVTAKGAQVRDAIENLGGCREAATEQQGQKETGENAHGRYSFSQSAPHSQAEFSRTTLAFQPLTPPGKGH